MKKCACRALASIGAVLWMGTFFVVVFFVIAWATTSILITSNGPVKWKEGFDKTIEHYFGR